MDTRMLRHNIRQLFNMREGRASHEQIRKRIIAGARIDGIHVCMLVSAMLIASVGLNVDSTEAVVGAMLICPLMGSVLAMAYAVATGDVRLFRDSLFDLGLQVILCLVTSTLYFIASPLSKATSELLTNSSATIWDLIIALVGGFAGAIGYSRQQEPPTLLAGVAVATALMPPLCATGYGLAMRDLGLAASAFYEFLINVMFIGFGAELVLVLLHVPLLRDINGDGVVTAKEEAQAKARLRAMRRRMAIGLLLFAIPCVFITGRVVRSSVEENGSVFEVVDTYDTKDTTRMLRVVCPSLVGYRIGSEDSYDETSGEMRQRVVATVETSEPLDDAMRQQVEALIRLNVENLDEVTFE